MQTPQQSTHQSLEGLPSSVHKKFAQSRDQSKFRAKCLLNECPEFCSEVKKAIEGLEQRVIMIGLRLKHCVQTEIHYQNLQKEMNKLKELQDNPDYCLMFGGVSMPELRTTPEFLERLSSEKADAKKSVDSLSEQLYKKQAEYEAIRDPMAEKLYNAYNGDSSDSDSSDSDYSDDEYTPQPALITPSPKISDISNIGKIVAQRRRKYGETR